MAKKKVEHVALTAALAKLVPTMAAAIQSDDVVLATKREEVLEVGGQVLDACARMTDADRKAHIESFIADVCSANRYAASSIADRSGFMRAMIYASPHKDNIVKATDYAIKQYEGTYQRARQMERTARHVKSRLNKPSEITLAALKRWVDADAKKKAAQVRANKRKGNMPAAPQRAALLRELAAWFSTADFDFIASGVLSEKAQDAVATLAKELTPKHCKAMADLDWSE